MASDTPSWMQGSVFDELSTMSRLPLQSVAQLLLVEFSSVGKVVGGIEVVCVVRLLQGQPTCLRGILRDCGKRRRSGAAVRSCKRPTAVHMSGDARGWARRLRVLRPDCGTGANLSGSRPCPRSSGHTLAARAFERLRTAATAHVWASSVAQTVWRDQCRADGHCKFNLACNAHARVARGGGANRGERTEACLTRSRYLYLRELTL